MKGNFGRRAGLGPAPPILAMVALLLTLGVVATTPLAFAKYVASGMVTASARVAKFSFGVVSTQPETRGMYNAGGVMTAPPRGPFEDDETWEEVAVYPSGSNTLLFDLPLFDTEYYDRGGSSTKTVISKNNDMVIAPGVNGISDHNTSSPGGQWLPGANIPANNPNNSGTDCRKAIVFKNNSEVAVKYKLELVPDSLLVGGPGIGGGVMNLGVWLDDTGALLYRQRWHPNAGTMATFTGWNNGQFGGTNGVNILRDTTVLAPGEEETLLIDYSWEFSQSDTYPNPEVYGWDEPDTALGLLAAKQDIYFNPRFELTVTQVD